MKILLVLSISLMLGGCAIPIEIARQNCASYGYQQGTLEMAQCLEADVQAQLTRRQRAAALLGIIGATGALLNHH